MRQTTLPRNLLFVIAIVLIPILFIAQSADPILRSLEGEYASRNIKIDLDKTLKVFKAQLIEKQLIKEKDLEDPTKIYAKLDDLLATVQPEEFKIPALISKAPLTSFLNHQDVLNASTSDQSAIALFTYYQLFSEKYAELQLYLTDSRLVQFKGEDLPINSFESVLFEEINNRKDRNVSLNNINIVFKADPATPTEFVNFISGKLRSMNIRKVTFLRLD